MVDAIQAHDTPFLFAWLVEVSSYQGIADAHAAAYMDAHGRLAFDDVARSLESAPACQRLTTYWHFRGCGYAKLAGTCAEPEHIAGCPLPRHDLRNGRLNQMAYALFLFLRDVCGGDFVGWIDGRLEQFDQADDRTRAAAMRDGLLEPLTHVYGVSFKVLAMALAELLLTADAGRERWIAAGASMIAVDTLVHNWLHRTGIARDCGVEHPYGQLCYKPGGCADVLERCSRQVDARAFCLDGPAYFPRLVQHAVWRFCAENGLNICNGNRINDRIGCMQPRCPLWEDCPRLPPP